MSHPVGGHSRGFSPHKATLSLYTGETFLLIADTAGGLTVCTSRFAGGWLVPAPWVVRGGLWLRKRGRDLPWTALGFCAPTLWDQPMWTASREEKSRARGGAVAICSSRARGLSFSSLPHGAGEAPPSFFAKGRASFLGAKTQQRSIAKFSAREKETTSQATRTLPRSYSRLHIQS
jgi:hypothetical protein